MAVFKNILKLILNSYEKLHTLLPKKKINYDIASLAEPLACCLNGFEQINFKPNFDVIIFGAGSIGQIIAKLCIHFKCRKVFLTDKNKYKIKNGFKNKKIIKLNFNELKKRINKNNKKNRVKYIFVACSSLSAQKQAIDIAQNDTNINFFAGLKKMSGKDPLLKINTNKIHYKQIKIVGSHGSKFRHLKMAGDLLINKKINLGDIISHVFNLKDYRKAFQKLISGNSLKIIIKPN